MIEANIKKVSIWLFVILLFTSLMVVIGGITRLTNSGLSITEWKPIMGAVPPLNKAQWDQTFEKYKHTPEFKKTNFDMQLKEFKKIFFWEFIHRLLGRSIGFIFLIPFLFFLYKKVLTKQWAKKTIILFILGGLQGLMGWYMVKSGLVKNPHVSHLRLAAHLTLALLVAAFCVYYILQLNKNKFVNSVNLQSLKPLIIIFVILIAVQIEYGAFVAGLKAGKIFNTWPLMGGNYFPNSLFHKTSILENLFSNRVMVQFLHRNIAILVLIITAIIYIKGRKLNLSKFENKTLLLTFSFIFLQFLLGIFTLIFAVPVYLGVIHQLIALILLMLSITLLYLANQKKI